MPNYNIVADFSLFKPYDISPALSILREYRDKYEKYQAELDKIAEEQGEYALPDNSKYKHVMDSFNAEYNNVVEDFSRGMNMKNAQSLRNLRRKYLSEISPIRKMVENYNKDRDLMASLGPDAIIGVAPDLDEYYGGVKPEIKYRSIKDIKNTAASVMQGLDNALMSSPTEAGNIAKQYFILKQQGLDSLSALKEILRHNPEGNKFAGETNQLIQALDNVYNSFSDASFSQNAKNKIWENTVIGAIQGIQAPRYSMQGNHNFESTAAKKSRELQEARIIAEMDERGYKYENGKFVPKEASDLPLTQQLNLSTLPDGSTWAYDKVKKQWVGTDSNWDGIPRTTAQLIKERDKQISDIKNQKDKETKNEQKALTALYGEPGKRTDSNYITLAKLFKPLNYTGRNKSKDWTFKEDDGKGWSGYVYSKFYGDNDKLTDTEKENLKPEVKTDILDRYKELNPDIPISLDDLDIYEDSDWFSNNHYRVVIKGSGERGLYKEEEKETETPNGTNHTEREEPAPADTTANYKPGDIFK